MLRSPHLARLTGKAFLLFSFVTVISWMIPGCSVTDFVGAYFNTFYNAKRQFSEAEDELLTQPDVKQKDRPFGYAFTIQATTKAKFAAVIEKCSKLLQYHPESNLVDDALLMIGKSYYYQNDYQPAERKFRELLDQFPNSDLVYESKLLLGYTYYMLNDKVKSSSVANELLEAATKNEEDDYIGRVSLFLAQLEVENKNIDQAKAHYRVAAEKGSSSDERCIAYLSLAGLLSQEGNNQRALEAYRNAESVGSGYQMTYKARVGQARMLSKLGAYEESLSMLRELLSSSKYKDFYGEVSLEIGNVFKDSKEYTSAIAQYTYVDTAYARTETSANSYFQLGDLYEARLSQFDSAQICYSKGKAEFSQAAITLQLNRRAEYLTKYLHFNNDIRRLDTIKARILSPPDTTHLVAAAVKDSTADSLRAKPDSAVARAPVLPAISIDSVNTLLAFNKTELAALFYTSMGLPDSAAHWYLRVLAEHPTSALAPRALFTLAQIYSLDSTRSRTTSDSLYKEITSRFPDSEFAPEAERLLGRPARTKVADPAEAAYARAEKLLSDRNSKAASDSLRMIVKTYPTSRMAAKAQYTLGWIYENRDVQLDSAAASYRSLLTLYPGSQYATVVRPRVDAYDLNKKALEQGQKDSAAARLRDSTSSVVKDTLNIKKVEKQGKKETPLNSDKPEESAVPPKQEKE